MQYPEFELHQQYETTKGDYNSRINRHQPAGSK